MNNSRDYAKGLSLAVFGVLVLSPDALIIRLVGADGWTISLYRTGFMAITLMIAALFVGRGNIRSLWAEYDRPALLASLLYSLATIMFIGSITRTLAANTLVIIASMPLMAAVFSTIFLKERQPRATWIAVVSVMAAVTFIFSASFGTGTLLGDSMALISACALGGNFTALRRSRLKNPLPTLIVAGVLACLLMAPFAAPLSVSPKGLVFLVIGGVVVQPLAFFLILSAPKFIPSPDVALVMLLETFTGPLLVWLVLEERPSAKVAIAGLVIVTAVATHTILAIRRGQSRTQARSDSMSNDPIGEI